MKDVKKLKKKMRVCSVILNFALKIFVCSTNIEISFSIIA